MKNHSSRTPSSISAVIIAALSTMMSAAEPTLRTVSLVSDHRAVVEGGRVPVWVYLDQPLDQDLTLQVRLTATPNGAATSSSTVTIPAGKSSAPIWVNAAADDAWGQEKSVKVTVDEVITEALQVELSGILWVALHIVEPAHAPTGCFVDLFAYPNRYHVKITEGKPFTLRARFDNAAGGPVTVAWHKNGVVIPGATQADLTIENAAPSDAGNYKAVITHKGGIITSNPYAAVVSPPDESAITPAATVFKRLGVPPEYAGSYRGLCNGWGGRYLHNTAVAFQVSRSGVVTGTLVDGQGLRLPFVSSVSELDDKYKAAAFHFAIRRKHQSTLVCSGELDAEGHTAHIWVLGGLFDEGSGDSLKQIGASSDGFNRRLVGSYTWLGSSGWEENAENWRAGGIPFGTFKVLSSGVILISGKLADGQVIRSTGTLSWNGQFVAHQVLPYSSKGSLALRGAIGGDISDPTTEVLFSFDWHKPPQANPTDFRAEGFGIQGIAQGSAYRAPASGQPVFRLPATEAGAPNVDFSAWGGIYDVAGLTPSSSSERSESVRLSPLANLSFESPAPVNIQMFDPRNGYISGTIHTFANGVLKLAAFEGVVVRNARDLKSGDLIDGSATIGASFLVPANLPGAAVASQTFGHWGGFTVRAAFE